MLVVLDVQKNKCCSFTDKIKSLFRPYEINADILTKNEIAVLYIKYLQKRGDIRFKKIYNYTIGAPKTILCKDDLSLINTPFSRFESDDFNIAMMKNFICTMLKKANIPPSELKISFFDPNAEFPLFAEKLLCYTSELTVVSNMPKFYENEAERHMNELGVSMIVSNSLKKLNSCDILICPSKIKVPLPTTSRSLIFTSHKPLVSVSGTVITRYIPEFPSKYNNIKPECIENLYFLSALYTLCGIIELENLEPLQCECNGSVFSQNQIIRHIKSQCTEYSLSNSE